MADPAFDAGVKKLMSIENISEREATQKLLAAMSTVQKEEPTQGPTMESLRGPGGPLSTRTRDVYSRVVAPVTDIAAEGMGRFFQSMVPGSTKTAMDPAEGYTKMATRMLATGTIPQTPERALLMALAPHIARIGGMGGGQMGLTRELLLNPLKRVGTAAAVGGGGAAITGGTPMEIARGAAEGALSQVPAEGIRGVERLATRGPVQGAADTSRLGGTLGTISDDFAGLNSPGDFLRRVVLGNEVTTTASNKLNAGLTLLEAALRREYANRLPPLATKASKGAGQMPGHPFSPGYDTTLMSGMVDPKATPTNLPSIAAMFPEAFGRTETGITLAKADSLFRTLGTTAFEDGALRAGVKARDIANARANAAREIEEWIQGYSPKLASQWAQMNHDYGRTQAIVRILRDPNVIDDKTGRLNMMELQKALRDPNTTKDLQMRLTENEVKDFYNAVFRTKRGVEAAGAIDQPESMPATAPGGRPAMSLTRFLTSMRPRQYVGEKAPQQPELLRRAIRDARTGVGTVGALEGFVPRDASGYTIEP